MWLLHGHWLLARLSSWRLNLKLAWHITVADDVVPILSRCSSLATSWLTTLLILIRKPNFIVVISLWFVMHFHHDLFVQILLLQHWSLVAWCLTNFIRGHGNLTIPSFKAHSVWTSSAAHTIVIATAKNIDSRFTAWWIYSPSRRSKFTFTLASAGLGSHHLLLCIGRCDLGSWLCTLHAITVSLRIFLIKIIAVATVNVILGIRGYWRFALTSHFCRLVLLAIIPAETPIRGAA